MKLFADAVDYYSKFKLNRNYKRFQEWKQIDSPSIHIKSSCKQFHYIFTNLFGVPCYRQKVIHHNAKLLLFGLHAAECTCCSCCFRCATRCTLAFFLHFDSFAIAPIGYQCIRTQCSKQSKRIYLFILARTHSAHSLLLLLPFFGCFLCFVWSFGI